MPLIKVATLAQLPPDTVTEVLVGYEPYAICNVGGAVRALSGVCIHRGGPLGQGQIHEGRVVCPYHMWEFDCVTGEYHNPYNGDGLQQTSNGLLVWRKADNFTAFTDGFWTCARLGDFVGRMDRIRGRTEVMGPFHPPAEGDLAAFIEGLRQRMAERLRQMRGSAGVAA